MKKKIVLGLATTALVSLGAIWVTGLIPFTQPEPTILIYGAPAEKGVVWVVLSKFVSTDKSVNQEHIISPKELERVRLEIVQLGGLIIEERSNLGFGSLAVSFPGEWSQERFEAISQELEKIPLVSAVSPIRFMSTQ